MPAMQTAAWKKPQFWLGIVISLICLGSIFVFTDARDIGKVLRSADFRYLIMGIALIGCFMLLRAVRWRFMLDNKIALWHIFHLQNIGYMLTQILPLRIGDPARAVLVGSEKNLTIGQGMSTMVVERVLDMLVIVLMLPIAAAQLAVFPDWLRDTARVSGILAVMAIAVVIIGANFRPIVHTTLTNILNQTPLDSQRWAGMIDDLLAGLNIFTSLRKGFLLILLTLAVWIPIIFSYQAFMLAAGLDADFIVTIFVVCAAAFSIATPSSPGQVGVFHAGVTLALTSLGFESANAASFAFLYHTFNFILLIMLGIIGLSRTQSSFGQVIEATRNLISQRKLNDAGV